MAQNIWLGRAKAVASVKSLTVGGTVAIGDTFTVTIDDLVDLQDKLRTFFEPLLKIGETNGETNIWKQNREQSDRQSCESITGSSRNATSNAISGNTNTSGTESAESARADARAISET